MSRVRAITIAAFATLMLSAAITSSASATEEWKINGVGLGAGHSAALAPLPKVDLSLILHFRVSTLSFLVLCGGLHLINGRIIPPNLAFIEKIDFLNCHTIAPTPTNCQLEGGQTTLTLVVTLPLLATAKSSTRGSLKPASGKLFGEVPVKEQTGCVLEGSIPVKGEVIGGAPTGGEEQKEQGLVGLGSEENNSLEIGSGNKGFLLGKILVSLLSGEPWSFR